MVIAEKHGDIKHKLPRNTANCPVALSALCAQSQPIPYHGEHCNMVSLDTKISRNMVSLRDKLPCNIVNLALW